jgi:hypothetical protein
MTAKQRAARAKFKAVVKEASKLRKKNPKLTQAQAVKQAWAISYSKERGGKKIGYSKERMKVNKNATKWLKSRKERDKNLTKVQKVAKAYEMAAFGPPQKSPKLGNITSPLATGTKTAKFAKQYIIDNIDLSGYNYPSNLNDVEKIKALNKIFNDEYGWAVNRLGRQRAIEEWLRGLPSSLSLAYYNDDIIDLAKSWGTLSANATQSQENKIVKNYWRLMAAQTLQLFDKVKNKIGKVEKHTDTKSHNVNIRVVSGIPHKAKYFIKTTQNGVEKLEYFTKLPKGYYKGMDGTLYLTRFEDAGTTLSPIRSVKNNNPVKKR